MNRNYRSSIPVLMLLSTALSCTAKAGPGGCMQTLIPLKAATHGKWLRGVLPARVAGVKGYNDVIVFQRKDGSYVLNEGANVWALPVSELKFGQGKILSERGTSNTDSSRGLLDTEVVRIQTHQNNIVDLHRLRIGQSNALILRGPNEDESYLASASKFLEVKSGALKRLIAKREEELKLVCDEIESPSVGSVAKLASSVITPLGSVLGEDDPHGRKRGIESDIKDAKSDEALQRKELSLIPNLSTQLQNVNASLPISKFDPPMMNETEAKAVLAEVVSNFIETMKDEEISATDRDEIKKYCGDAIELPEAKLTSSQKLEKATCESLPGQQKDLCLSFMKLAP